MVKHVVKFQKENQGKNYETKHYKLLYSILQGMEYTYILQVSVLSFAGWVNKY